MGIVCECESIFDIHMIQYIICPKYLCSDYLVTLMPFLPISFYTLTKNKTDSQDTGVSMHTRTHTRTHTLTQCAHIYMWLCTVYLLIYRTAKNNYFGNCLGIIGIGRYEAREMFGMIYLKIIRYSLLPDLYWPGDIADVKKLHKLTEQL